MDPERLRARIEHVLDDCCCDVKLDGSRPWDPQVKDPRLYARIFRNGSLGLGDAYVDGWWTCESLDGLFHRLLAARVDRRFRALGSLVDGIRTHLLNPQTRTRSEKVALRHYDLGNDLFDAMLGDLRVYSCAVWRNASRLEEAQEQKLEMVCDKLGLKPGMRILDIGCGWGDTARFLAQRHGAEVVGITVSGAQVRAGRERCRGLPVEIALRDYRDVTGSFDRIVSLGMFEHVGPRNHRRFMEVLRSRLGANGLALVQTIGTQQTGTVPDRWIEHHIFPNSKLPSAAQIARAAEGLLAIQHWENIGPNYDTTLMHWHDNFEAAWPELRKRYDERFRRMWRYYLLSCAGTFRARRLHVWQVLLSPEA